jgi:hypothetical protein
MDSNVVKKSEIKYEKATNILWKVWWFCWYLLILPSGITAIGYFIFLVISNYDPFISLGFSVLTFIFSSLFFYKFYDKYRSDPVFLNQTNNPTSRIHILFLITIFSLIVTPIFVYITPPDYSFELLPLISFCVLYLIVFYYYYFKPIDFFNASIGEFKHSISFSLASKQLYNIIIILNFIIHILFLSFLFNTQISWLFALITNTFFYFNTLVSTKNIRKIINDSVKENKIFLKELIIYHKKYSVSILSLIFVLLIQIPFDIIGVYRIIYGIIPTLFELINAFFLSMMFFLIYLKTRLYLAFYYKKILMRLPKNEI